MPTFCLGRALSPRGPPRRLILDPRGNAMSSNSNGHLSHPLNMAVDTASQLPSGASVCANPADTSAASEAMEHSSESSSDKEGGRGEGAGSWDLCQDDPSAASEASVPDGFTLLNKAPGKMQQRPWAPTLLAVQPVSDLSTVHQLTHLLNVLGQSYPAPLQGTPLLT